MARGSARIHDLNIPSQSPMETTTMNRKQILASYKRVSDEIQAAKVTLAKEIRDIIKERQLTQNDAAFLLNDAPSQISLVVTGKLRGFSMERLIRMRAMLDGEVRILTNTAAKARVATGSWKNVKG